MRACAAGAVPFPRAPPRTSCRSTLRCGDTVALGRGRNRRHCPYENGFQPFLSSPVYLPLRRDDTHAILVECVDSSTQPAGEKSIPDGRLEAQFPAIELERASAFDEEIFRRRLGDMTFPVAPRHLDDACEFGESRNEEPRPIARDTELAA